jgi:TetR/AcrR family transcriptional regulator, tetracycline repressor protein
MSCCWLLPNRKFLSLQDRWPKGAVIETALKMLEKDGLHQLTMRALADRLGIKAASLYNHFPDKSALLNQIQEAVLQKFIPPRRLNPWQDHLRDLAASMRQGLTRRPYAISLFANRPALSPTAFAQVNTTFTVLRDAGFTPTQVVFLYQSLAVFVFGHASAEVGKVIDEDGDTDMPDFSKMNLEQFPMLRELGPLVQWDDFDTWFEIGVETLISGTEEGSS